MVVIRAFSSEDNLAFRALNTAWIEQHFGLEEKDIETLAHPNSLIEGGGAILMAEIDGEAIGCVALIRFSYEAVELAKMTVAQHCRNRGVGAALLAAAIDTARRLDVKRVYLESNSSLTAALSLYERAGFRHLSPSERPSSPYKTADVFMELLL